MFVHADQAGDDGVAREIHALRSGGNGDAGGAAHGRDLSVIDDDGLIFGGGRTGAIDHAHVHQRDHRIVDADKRLRPGLKPILRLRD